MKKDIVIAGAGLVGSLLSIYLARRGYRVKIYERRSDMRVSKVEAGRSINLALSDRGLLALEKVGLAEEVKKIAIPMHGRFMHNADGSTAFQPYGKEGQYINSVSRATLNMKLMSLAEKEGVEIFFDSKCSSVDWKNNTISFENAKDSRSAPSKSSTKGFPTIDSRVQTTDYKLLFGADGAFSATRLQLQGDHFYSDQSFIDCGYKELTIPAGAGGSFRIEKNVLHIWPRKDYMLIALPNLDGNFTCTLFFPFEGQLSFQKLDTEGKVLTFFEKNFRDVLPLIPDLTKQFFQNPVSSLVTVKCYPWIHGDQFALIGDAAHAIVPFFGQGMNCGFEDCRVLDELIGVYGDDWKKILEQYQSLRKPDADAIADMAVNNFIEMREKTADPKFLLQKKIEVKLHEKYPDKWIPAYTQVTFCPQIRYSEALRNTVRQEEIMKEVMQLSNIDEIWNSETLHQQIIQRV